MKKLIRQILILALYILNSGCASTTDGGEVGANGKQFLGLTSSAQMNEMANQSFQQVKQDAASKKILNTKPDLVARVKRIADQLIPLTTVFRKDALEWKWETHVITSDELNAYCMPGGKIVFYTGIIEKIKMTDGEIAAVMGHEISHALREHGRERMAQEQLKQVGQVGLQILMQTGKIGEGTAQATNVGVGLISLKYGRGQETEADDMGLELMARAGYNPQEAVNLWIKMSQAGGAKPPEWMSTHPSDETRIKRIQSLIPRLIPIYQQNKKNG